MKKSQKGFAALEAVLILIIAGIICGAAYYVWHSSQKTNSILDAVNKSSDVTTKAAQKNEGNGAKSDSSQSQQKYLTIKEWGVKFAISDKIKDAYYTPGKKQSYFNLRVHSLDGESDCSNGDLSVSAIERLTQSEYNELKNSDAAPNFQGIPKVGNYYYYITHAQYGCAQNNSLDDQVISVEKEFTDATQSIQAE
jgi:archaellum component FlaF (FlaF/FlaG flagellin family)